MRKFPLSRSIFIGTEFDAVRAVFMMFRPVSGLGEGGRRRINVRPTEPCGVRGT